MNRLSCLFLGKKYLKWFISILNVYIRKVTFLFTHNRYSVPTIELLTVIKWTTNLSPSPCRIRHMLCEMKIKECQKGTSHLQGSLYEQKTQGPKAWDLKRVLTPSGGIPREQGENHLVGSFFFFPWAKEYRRE